ncbi:helix-turn-helix domain-containing protein [Lawsonibacter sp. JLR.KK007]|uniref:helix-turn-helix domain-containing protein n=1 Tax=Lawsonibacter sp. JLR.KK007 TaxID=3114293 RepID=UPI002FF316BA
MGGFYSHPFFANLYETFKNFSYYISKVNDLPSGRKKNRCWAGRFPRPVIEAARTGDAEAVERVLRYYEGYIGSAPQRQQDKQQKHKAKQSESGPQG